MTPPRFVLPLWPVIDRLLQAAHKIRPLRSVGRAIMSVELKRYDGPLITLDDKCQVKPGDRIIELHLNTTWFSQRRELTTKGSQPVWQAIRSFVLDLRFLGEQMAEGRFCDVAALHGTTFLGVAASRVGFQIEELPDTIWKTWAQFYLLGITQVYHLPAVSRSKAMTKPQELRDVWLSRETFLNRYGLPEYRQ